MRDMFGREIRVGDKLEGNEEGMNGKGHLVCRVSYGAEGLYLRMIDTGYAIGFDHPKFDKPEKRRIIMPKRPLGER